MFEMLTDRRTDDGVTGILLAHQWAFGSCELKRLALRKTDILILIQFGEKWEPVQDKMVLIKYAYYPFTPYAIFKTLHHFP